MRKFETGATRDNIEGKPQYEGYLSPLVIKRFGEYMLQHQTQADGTRRDPDNWQRGIDKNSYMDSMWRHFMDVWLYHRGHEDEATESLEDALCAMLFNVQGYLFEELKQEDPVFPGKMLDAEEIPF